MLLFQLSLLAVLFILGFCEDESNSTRPCDDFYEYVCEKKYPRVPARLRDFRSLGLSTDIDQYQEYVVQTREPAKRLWDAVDLDTVSKWLVQFETYRDGIHWTDHKKRHENFPQLSLEQKKKSLENLVEPHLLYSRFYKSLKQSVQYLAELKIPISTHNHFYHGLFDEVRNMHISEIKKYSKFDEQQKQQLIDKVKNVKMIFPYLEYNNITVWRQAKTEYEREYYRLKSIINETEIAAETVEKIIRVAAVQPAMTIFEAYMKEFTPRFIFQHVVAAPSMDSFNYQNEVHVSVFTMIDPIKNPKSVYTRFLFVMNHEIQHVHFNIDPPPFDSPEWAEEKKCVVDQLNHFRAGSKDKDPDWDLEKFYYEDMANVGGLRLLVLYTAQKTSDNQEIRDAIEQSMATFCTNKRQNTEHNPHDVSINTMVSQLPTFNSLYNCSAGDRMYVKTENLCETLNIDFDGNDYNTQKVDGDQLFMLSQFMDVLENTADELDAANITTFEGELFDITVEDVEEQEEELEGSAESSESSESEEDVLDSDDRDDLAKDLEDSEKAEIVSASRTVLSTIATILIITCGLFVN